MNLHRGPSTASDGLNQLRDGHVVGRADNINAVEAVDDPGAGLQNQDDGLVLQVHVHTREVGDHGLGHPAQVVGVAESRGQPARAPAGAGADVLAGVRDAHDGLMPRELGGDLGRKRIAPGLRRGQLGALDQPPEPDVSFGEVRGENPGGAEIVDAARVESASSFASMRSSLSSIPSIASNSCSRRPFPSGGGSRS